MGNPHLLSAGQAAKAAGVTTPTISKAIKKGRLSFVERTANGYLIDPAELFRVFPPVAKKEAESLAPLGLETPSETPAMVELRVGNARLEAELAAMKMLADELRQDRDEWRKQAQTLLLVDQSRKASERKGGFWSWLTGHKPANA
ncbi:MAG: hypothetical protein F9K29_25255 [Hyphomicrobiaceae bacterium]|nr:MAG: hypothetical protein F9K29_25255 [Hyphomicrobiaceae bacterium]